MLATSLWRHIADSSLDYFEKRLLDAFPRDILRDGDVSTRLPNLVDLIDVDDATLGLFDVVVGSTQQATQDILDIIPDVTGFREVTVKQLLFP